MLFYHKTTCNFMIYVYLTRTFFVAIYALFPPIFWPGKETPLLFVLLECMMFSQSALAQRGEAKVRKRETDRLLMSTAHRRKHSRGSKINELPCRATELSCSPQVLKITWPCTSNDPV